MSEVRLNVKTEYSSSERRFPANITVEQLKGRLELITGIDFAYQQLLLSEASDDGVNEQTRLIEVDGSSKLESLNIKDGSFLKVIDTRPSDRKVDFLRDEANDDERYTMSQKEYEERSDTVLAFKRQHKLGRFGDNSTALSVSDSLTPNEKFDGLVVGARCRVTPGDKLGTVRYIGVVPQIPQPGIIWVGVEYDEPVGKNDGTLNDVRYFETMKKHGAFVRSFNVELGAFPSETYEEL